MSASDDPKSGSTPRVQAGKGGGGGAGDPDHARRPCAKCGQVHKRCTAHNKRGGPCGQQALRGSAVCRSHGGKAPQTRKKAAERIEDARQQMLDMIEPLLIRLRDIALDDATDNTDLIRLYKEIANRVGLSERHVVVPREPLPWERMADEFMAELAEEDRAAFEEWKRQRSARGLKIDRSIQDEDADTDDELPAPHPTKGLPDSADRDDDPLAGFGGGGADPQPNTNDTDALNREAQRRVNRDREDAMSRLDNDDVDLVVGRATKVRDAYMSHTGDEDPLSRRASAEERARNARGSEFGGTPETGSRTGGNGKPYADLERRLKEALGDDG